MATKFPKTIYVKSEKDGDSWFLEVADPSNEDDGIRVAIYQRVETATLVQAWDLKDKRKS